MSGTDAVRHALATALAGEHAAVYAYGVVGGVVPPTGADEASALDAFAAHSTRRDRIARRVRDLGAEPAPAEAGYALPRPVSSAATAAALARAVEDRCAVLYAGLVASSTDDLRREAADWLADAATRALGWGAPSTAFPGVAAV